MFDSLSDRLSTVFDRLRGRGALSEDDVRGAMREVRIALLEADVALPVVRRFVDSVTERSTWLPTAFSVTASMNLRATGSATSASSSAMRTSRIASRTSASFNAPRPRRRSKTPVRRSESVSNMGLAYSKCGTAPADETSSASGQVSYSKPCRSMANFVSYQPNGGA